MPPSTIDEYLRSQPPGRRAVLERVRGALRRGLGECEEVISYQIPAFRVAGRVTLYFAGWAEHFAIYPLTRAVIDALGAELEPYEQSGRGTIRFSYAERPPLRLIGRIAKLRAAESRATTAAKGARKNAKKAAPRSTPRKVRRRA